MTERFTADLLFIVIVLLVAALLGFLIGYFLRKSMKCKKCAGLEEENSLLKLRIKKHEEDYLNLKERITKLDNECVEYRLKIEELETAALKTQVKKAAKKSERAMGGASEDDLKVVLGIGPKISGILKKKGIRTWKALSEASASLITEYLLSEGGERYRIHNPATWPEQARLAHEGLWDELSIYQGKIEK